MAQKQATTAKDLDAIGPAFEVATIRPVNRDDGRRWFGTKVDASGRFQASAVSLSILVFMAYRDPPNKVNVTKDSALPKWADSDNFDIQAKVDDAYTAGWDRLSDEQRWHAVQPMVRRLLAERFHVKLGVETRMTPVYALVQAKGGAHVKEVAAPAPVDGDGTGAASRWMADHPGKPFQGMILCGEGKCTGYFVSTPPIQSSVICCQ